MLGISRSKLLERWTDQLWKRLTPEWKLTSGVAIRLDSISDWIVFCDLFVDLEYDPAIRRLLEATSKQQAPCVVDLGANVGFFILRLHHLWRQTHGDDVPVPVIHAFEASQRLSSELQSRLARQPYDCRVSLRQGLVGKRRSTGRYKEDLFHISNRVDPGGAGAAQRYIDVEATLPRDSRIALLKCDIEGSELDFITEYPELLDRTDAVLIELHDEHCDVDQCRRLLIARGFDQAVVLREFRTFSVELFSRA